MDSEEMLHNIEEKPKVGLFGESHCNGASYLYQVVLQDHNYSVSGNSSTEGVSAPPSCKEETSEVAYDDHGRCPLPNNSPLLSPHKASHLPHHNHHQAQHPSQHSRTSRSNGLKVVPPASPSSKMPPTNMTPRRKRSDSGSNAMAMTLKAVDSSPASVPHSFSGLDALSAAARLKPSYDAHQAALKENRTSDADFPSKTVNSSSASVNGIAASPLAAAAAAGPMASFFSGWGGWWKDSRPPGLWNTPGDEHEGVITRPKFNPDDGDSSIDSDSDRFPSDREGEETETAPECEGEEDAQEESITRCICDFGHDDGYMICCDRCSVWQHVDCMGIDRSNIPDEYLCELCQPRRVDKARARGVQYRKRQEFRLSTPPLIKDPLRDRPTFIQNEIREEKPRKNSWSGRGSRGRGGTSKSSTREVVHTNNNKESKPRRGPKLGRKRSRKEDPDSEDASTTKPPNPGTVRRRKLWREKHQQQEQQQQQLDSSQDSCLNTPRTPDPRDLASPVENTPVQYPANIEWIEDYEEAVTNHYSPELRARVGALKPNGVLGSENGAHAAGNALVVPDSPVHELAENAQGWQSLFALRRLQPGQTILECRGKLMLPSQLRPSSLAVSGNVSVALPHVIFYSTGLGEGHLEVCLDGRSYGNEARFLKQSCVPNAEIKHTLGKGLIHLYLVAKTSIAEKEEIVVAHESKNWVVCGHKKCPAQRTSPRTARISITEEPKKRRRRTSSATVSAEILNSPQRRSRSISKVSIDSGHEGADLVSPVNHPGVFGGDHEEQGDCQGDEHKKAAKTREERKMEAIMKAFERMEKQAQRKQEAIARSHRRDSQSSPKKHDDGEDADEESDKKYDLGERRASIEHKEKGKYAKRGCGRKRGRMRRPSAVLSMGERSRTSSGDMQSPTLDEETDMHSPFPGSNVTTPLDESEKGDMISFKCPKTKKLMASNWPKDQAMGNGDPLNSPTTPQDAGLAVPLCYMRSPKSPTRAGQRSYPVRHPSGSSSIPALALVRSGPASPDMAVPAGSVLAPGDGPGSDEGSCVNPEVRFAKKRWLRQAISEETEVAAEHSHSHGTMGPALVPIPALVTATAAVSQESVSSGAGSQDLEHVTPLKKRRLARASMSSEASFTPPSTPTPGITPTLEDLASENLQKSVLRQNLDKAKAEIKVEELDVAVESEGHKDGSPCEESLVEAKTNGPDILPEVHDAPVKEEFVVLEKEESSPRPPEVDDFKEPPPPSPLGEEIKEPLPASPLNEDFKEPPPPSLESEVDDLTKDDPFFRPDRAVFANPEAPDVLEQFTNPSRPSPSPPPPPLPPVETNPHPSFANVPSPVFLAAPTLPPEMEVHYGAKLSSYTRFGGSDTGPAAQTLPNGGYGLATGYMAAPPPLLPEIKGFAPTVVGLIPPPVCPPSLWPPEVKESPVMDFVKKPAWDFRTSRTQLTKPPEPVEPEPAPVVEETPKPAKKKLSILEYRKRKLTCDEISREESDAVQKLSKNDSSEDHFCIEEYPHDGTNAGEGLPEQDCTEETLASDKA